MEKIRLFDNSLDNSVSGFNKIFPETPIRWRNKQAVVEVLDVCGPQYRRNVTVDGKEITHDFYIVLGIDKITPGKRIYRSEFPSNRLTRNTVMNKAELSLSPNHYYFLQYLRGCQNPYHTYHEIAANSSVGYNTVKKALLEMEEKGVIFITPAGKHHRFEVMISEEWQ